jgi:hypothetical protein
VHSLNPAVERDRVLFSTEEVAILLGSALGIIFQNYSSKKGSQWLCRVYPAIATIFWGCSK